MYKFIYSALLLFFVLTEVRSQTTSSTVVDKQNNGQLKRMVMIQWDDWEPDPGSNFLGIPKNIQGFLYWQVLHRSYYKGSDLRPWKPTGPFPQNYASLLLQYEEDKKIRDQTKSIYQTDFSTMVNMSGGELDIPYQIFFKGKFNSLFDALNKDLVYIAKTNPKLFNELQQQEGFQTLMEWFEEAKDRIEVIHQSFADKGKRIEAYLDVVNEMRSKSSVFASYLQLHYFLNQLPVLGQIPTTVPTSDGKTDKQIVEEILKTWRY
jgi:hypothetical protein